MSGKFGLVAAATLMGAILAAPTAQARSIAEYFTECGIGGMIAGESSPMSASTLNLTTGGSSATTTGISSEEMCVEGPYQSAIFIKESFSALETDLAVGKGEHLQALNTIMACDFAAQSLRKEYTEFATSTAYNIADTSDKAEKMFQIVERHLTSQACGV